MRDLHLYINNSEVDLGDESLVLYNWSETELSNPSNTQNSFSKVITLKGTKKNNKVFSHLWNIERVQTYEGELNASRRIPFRITYDGDNVFEEGYCKLQNIKRVNGVYQYEISLFGMIGNFLNNLATNYTDGSVKTLADLKYLNDDGEEIDLDFQINAQTVYEAWNTFGHYDTKWSIINFANVYNGIPTTLDADKVMIDGADGYSPFITTATTKEGTNYSTYAGKVVMELPNKLSKDEIKDYRSYLMTPVINCKRIIRAICDKINNAGEYDGGYDIELDPYFFNSNCPYYENAWMTLPQITSIKSANKNASGSETQVHSLSLFKKETRGRLVRYTYNIELPEKLTTYQDFDISFGFTVASPADKTRDMYLRGTFQKELVNAYGVQAYAITDEAASEYENIIGGSNINWYTSDEIIGMATEGKTTYEKAKELGYEPKYQNDITVTTYPKSVWKKEGTDRHNFTYNGNDIVNIKFPAPPGTRNVRVCFDMFSEGGYINPNAIIPIMGEGIVINSLLNDFFSCSFKEASGFISNRLVTKQNLLTTNYSVKDWLLSYCKMFGLYIWYDLATNKIHIDTRKTFYKRDTILNIDGKIDQSKDYSIKPIYAETKFYNMTQQQVQSNLADDYTNEFGKTYGMKTIDTGIEWEVTQKELMDLKFKSAIMTNLKSIYNYKPIESDGVCGITPYMCNGITYNLYKNGTEEGETYEVKYDSYVVDNLFQGQELQLGRKYADYCDKPLFANGDKVSDSSSVLLMHNGFEAIDGFGYYLSDDIPTMETLNGKPTWIVTNDFENKDYIIPVSFVPSFSRYWMGGVNILHSLDFGSPRKLYIDDAIHYEENTLYDRYYKTYYEDLYDVNTKVLNCYYKPTNVMSIKDIQKFYWFDNSLWRLNKITDYNPENKEFVKAEFIKVQDINNITSEQATTAMWIRLILNSHSVPAIGGTITGIVKTYDYGPWSIEEADDLSVYPYGYSTNSEITIDVPPNTTQDELSYFLGVSAGDVATRETITQEAGGGEYAAISFTIDNQTSDTIRLGARLYYAEEGIAYRTIAPGTSVTYIAPIPASGTQWHYDIELTDVFGNAAGYTYTFTKPGVPTIQGDSIEEFNYEATNIGAQTIQGGTITVE